ncbi:MAG: hypothetical protein M3P33_03345 [bacterium]|nr:hypothetical protein [bacterium]
MTYLDFLYLCLALGFVSICVFLNIVLYNIIIAIQTMRKAIENFQSYTQDAVNIKDSVKLTVLRNAQKAVAFFKRK